MFFVSSMLIKASRHPWIARSIDFLLDVGLTELGEGNLNLLICINFYGLSILAA